MIRDKKILAFVPGKTGSVGLPGKLFRKIGDYSLLQWTLMAASRCLSIDKVVTSSNDPDVRKKIEAFSSLDERFEFLQRPDELCTPMSKTEAAIEHLLEHYPDYDYLVILQGTSPARRFDLLSKCIEKAVIEDYDSLITVEKVTPFFWRKNAVSEVPFCTYDLKNRPMRQELKESDYYFHDNGNIYITKCKCFLKTKIRVSGNTYLYETPQFESMQIDNMDDLAIMSKMFNHYGGFL
jgi:CMP-N-acetylneuraminic acid synthetase